MSEYVRMAQARRVLRLMDETDEFGSDIAGRTRHLMESLSEILEAELAGSTLESDFSPGAKGCHRVDAVVGGNPSLASAIHVMVERGFEYHPLAAAMVRARRGEPNEVLTARRTDLVSDRSWFGSRYYQEHLQSSGLEHLLVSIRCGPTLRHAHGLGFYRRRGARAFAAEERNLLALFHNDIQTRLTVTHNENAAVAGAGEEALIDVVRREIRRGFQVKQSGLDSIARELRMSPRTLQRRLHEQRANFSELLDEERRVMSESLQASGLTDTRAVADALSFATPSAYRKARKRWLRPENDQFSKPRSIGANEHRAVAKEEQPVDA